MLQEPIDLPGQCWTEALSRDAGAARAFCSAAVPGREAVTDPGGHTGSRCDGEPVAGLVALPERVLEAAPSHGFVSSTVSDLDAALGAVAELGGVVEQPPSDLQDGRFAVVEDPRVAAFGLFAPQPGAG